jgi:membrane protease YdiL (CAAX protease family)
MVDGLMTGTVNLVLFGLLVLIRRVAHRERFDAFGLQTDARGLRLLLAGLAAGTLVFLVYPIIAVALGVGRVFVMWAAASDTLVLLGVWGFGFVGVALFEEGLFRGYLLSQLSARFSGAVAIVAQAVIFAAFHLGTYSASRYVWLGLLNVGVLAVVQAVLVVRTHSLMAAVGFHLAWDVVQTLLLMQQLKGVDTVLNLRITEGLWAGTAFTPEAGLIVSVAVTGFGVLLAAANVFHGPIQAQAL